MDISNIIITGRIYKEMEEILSKKGMDKNFRYLSESEVNKDDLQWADALVSFQPPDKFEFGSLKWVHSLGAGVDRFLHNRQWKEDVVLTRTICSFGEKISEYCLSYILRDLQFHSEYEHLQAKKKWKELVPKRLKDQKVIIYGTGVIGQQVAKLLAMMGAEVIGVSLRGKQRNYFNKVLPVQAKELSVELHNVDYVINTLPLTEKTYKLFDQTFFLQLSKVCLINVGRGATIDENALLMALEKENISKAVLDVFSEEPLPETNRLWEHNNIIITPHISAVTTPQEAVDCFIDTLRAIEGNRSLSNIVDVEKGF
ncbi:D-2-hydroxyacid dehydrogenase [Anaerobacillus sp. MEB173]|uniref:D-2-hydroxyacid dehydrogenase n=1 Tax=Anaerobacillus sp. MEB173 TaxID=3383345 RepID=UPI003F8FF470